MVYRRRGACAAGGRNVRRRGRARSRERVRGGWANAGPAQIGPAQIGPAQINALSRPDLCWEASGNGAPVTLEDCDTAIQNQQWTQTPNGVLMNGIGYCLEGGTGAVRGGEPLIIDFAGQCGGTSGQRWQFSGTTGRFTRPGTGVCAVPGGRLEPGTEIVRGVCSAAAGQRWSLGYSAVTVSAGTGTGTGAGTGAGVGAGAGSGHVGGTFTASVTVANAASAQTAYGAGVRLGAPRGLTVIALRGTGGAAGWTCDVRALTCTGTLAAGAAGRIDVAGRISAGARRGSAYVISAAATVAGTSPQPGTAPASASVRVTVLAAAPGAGSTAAGSRGGSSRGGMPVARSSPGFSCSAAACWWPSAEAPPERAGTRPGRSPPRGGPEQASRQASGQASGQAQSFQPALSTGHFPGSQHRSRTSPSPGVRGQFPPGARGPAAFPRRAGRRAWTWGEPAASRSGRAGSGRRRRRVRPPRSARPSPPVPTGSAAAAPPGGSASASIRNRPAPPRARPGRCRLQPGKADRVRVVSVDERADAPPQGVRHPGQGTGARGVVAGGSDDAEGEFHPVPLLRRPARRSRPWQPASISSSPRSRSGMIRYRR